MAGSRPVVMVLAGLGVAASCAGTRSGSTAGRADDTTLEQVEAHYDVGGATAAELHGELLRRGPQVDGIPSYASNEWEVRWRVRTVRGGTGCRIRDVRVRLQITTRLPRWSPPAGVQPELARAWATFLAALAVHERGHRDLGVEAAREVLSRLEAERPLEARTCQELTARADAVARRTVQRFREENRRYDEITAHGANQGVRWPPAGV